MILRFNLFLSLFLFPLLWAAPARAEKLHCPNVTDNDEKNTEVARRYFQMGGMFFDKADYTKAAESYECVLKFVPYSLTARYKLAKSYDGMELYSKAREQYELILVYDSKDAESLKPEIRKRLAEIKDLRDKVTTAPVAVEAPSTDEKTCPSVVQKNLQEALPKASKLLDARDWAKARTLIEDTLGKLAGATQEQRTLCHGTEAGLSLLILAGVANFNLANLETARDNFTTAFRIKSDAAIPPKYANAKLLAFHQETLNAYFELVKAERARLLRIKELEENFGVPAEPAENPATPVEHTPPAEVANGKPMVFVCRVQDELAATSVKMIYRIDDGPAQEMSMEKLGTRRYAVVLPKEMVTFARFSYHLVALTVDGREAGLWGSVDKPHLFVLREEKPVDKPVEKPVDKPVEKPVDKPPVTPKKAAPWTPRFTVSGGLGGEAGYITSGKETEAGAEIDGASFAAGPMVVHLELGYHLAPRHRLSLLTGMGWVGVEGYEDGSITERYKEDKMTLRLFLRYVYFLGQGRLRPYAGAGVGWADLTHTVRTDDITGGGNDLYDSHTMTGVFTDFVAGVQVCLTKACGLSAHLEANYYWNAWNSDGEDDSISNLAFHFLAGLGVHF